VGQKFFKIVAICLNPLMARWLLESLMVKGWSAAAGGRFKRSAAPQIRAAGPHRPQGGNRRRQGLIVPWRQTMLLSGAPALTP